MAGPPQFFTLTPRTANPVGPTHPYQIVNAGLLCGKELFKFFLVARKLSIDVVKGVHNKYFTKMAQVSTKKNELTNNFGGLKPHPD
jgi:hypothetical protein